MVSFTISHKFRKMVRFRDTRGRLGNYTGGIRSEDLELMNCCQNYTKRVVKLDNGFFEEANTM